MTHTQNQPLGGFTIMELLVAIGIASLLMLMISQLFINTSRAIQVGVRTGDMLVESEVIADQLRRDFSRMLPADVHAGSDPDSPAGFLVIINRQVPQAVIRYRGYDREEWTNYIPNRWPREGGLTLPDTDPNPPDLTVRWPRIRSDMVMFIGRATTDEDRFQAMTPQRVDRFHNELHSEYARIWYGHVLRTSPDGSTNGALGEPGTINHRASDWLLGRHQLLLNPTGFDSAHDIYSANAEWASSVSNYHDAPTAAGEPFDGGVVQYDGLTDITAEELTGPSGLIAQFNDTSDPYHERIEKLFAVNPGPNVALRHIRANPAPSPMSFEAWQMAQTHPILASNVSDFIVEFAGDYTSSGDIDRDGDDIKWYVADPSLVNEPGDGYDPRRPTTYLFPGFSSGNSDVINNVLDDQGVPNASYVLFAHDDPDNWPYLIRIRYRMHDTRGNVMDSVTDDAGNNYPLAGRWFEHIIRVPRP